MSGRELTVVDFSSPGVEAHLTLFRGDSPVARRLSPASTELEPSLPASLVSSTALIAESARLADRHDDSHHAPSSPQPDRVWLRSGRSWVGLTTGRSPSDRTWQGVALMTAAVRGNRRATDSLPIPEASAPSMMKSTSTG